MERAVFHASSRPQGMEKIIPVLIPVTYVLMLALEHVFPARRQPKVRGWLLKGIVCFVLTGVLAGVMNAAIPAALAGVTAGRSPLHLDALGTVLGGLVAFLASDLVEYVLHRVMHNVPVVWRWTHQMHHSAERIDIAGASYFHPFDFGLRIAATSLVVLLLGVTPDAAALGGYIGFFAGMFQHWNVRTPQWLGWVIQRPEAHAVHHARGVHAYNYGNFPLWDILLGTYRNPATFGDEAGFWDGASSKVGSMLLGRDVGQPS
jgi:sterol desaturase/sphingolipid hydroxylase (fatty acid hydroxylase superfamily)